MPSGGSSGSVGGPIVDGRGEIIGRALGTVILQNRKSGWFVSVQQALAQFRHALLEHVIERAFDPPLEWLGNPSIILPGGATAVAVPVEAHPSEHGMERALADVRSMKGDAGGDQPLTESLQQGGLGRPA
jgi:hypothetical protein